MTLSNELKELYASGGADVILETIEINHSSFDSPFYLVRDWQDLTATLESGQEVTFQKYSFDIVPDSKNEQGVRKINLNIDSVDQAIVNKLENAIANGATVPMTVYYRLYLSSDTSGPQNDPPVLFFLTDAQVNLQRMTATAEIPSMINRKFPNVVYEATVFQSLARSV